MTGLDDLVDRSEHDAGAPFAPQALGQLAAMKMQDRAEFERVRSRLKALGVRVGELDLALCELAPARKEAGLSGALTWPEETLWPNPVAGAELLDEIAETIGSFVVLPSYASEAMALWLVFAHAHNVWPISPRLAITSPEKRCGKTTALSVLQHLVPKPLPASNITASAVFRSIEAASPTLLIDEADTFLQSSDELRGILNSGHNRTQAYVVRTVGDDHVPSRFCTWAPVIIAMIGNLPDTLNDRSIMVPLRRKKPGEIVQRFRLDRVGNFNQIRQKIARWAVDNRDRLAGWDGEVPVGLHDRAADNWRPLIAIGDVAGGRWAQLARDVALALTDAEDEHSISVMLLKDIKELFDRMAADRLPTELVLEQLHRLEHRPWPEWRQGRPISARQLARLLQPFGVVPGTIRLEAGRTAKGYKLAAFADPFERYLAQSSVTMSQSAESLLPTASRDVTAGAPMAEAIQQSTSDDGVCDGVTEPELQRQAQEGGVPGGYDCPPTKRIRI